MIMKSKFLLMLGLFANLQVHASFESIVGTLEKTSPGTQFSGQLFSIEDREFFLEVLNNNPNFLLRLDDSYERYDLSDHCFILKHTLYDDGKFIYPIGGDFKLNYSLHGQIYPIDDISVGYQFQTTFYGAPLSICPTLENYRTEFFQIGFEDGKPVYGFLQDDAFREPLKGRILEKALIYEREIVSAWDTIKYKRRIDSAWGTIDYIEDETGFVQTFREIFIDHAVRPLKSGMIINYDLNVSSLFKRILRAQHLLDLTVQEGGKLSYHLYKTNREMDDEGDKCFFPPRITIPNELIRNIFAKDV
jgi:hypothetical protein